MKHRLEFKNISKNFSGVQVLRNISFSMEGGKVFALVGENGAGKSTLLKILNGDYQPSSGSYVLDGEERHFQSPNEAIGAGIGLIYQERQMFDELSVAENIYAGRLPCHRGFIDYRELNIRAEKIIREFGLPVKPEERVRNLSAAMQQMVEIMKVCSRNPRVLAFDEPTACLSDQEAEGLFKLIERLKEEGLIVIYVSHRMNEVFRLSDQIVVLKDGEFAALHNKSDTDEISLVNQMVGRSVKSMFRERRRTFCDRDIILKVKGLKGQNFHNISFHLMKGEILGFFGLVGAGRSELMKAVIGAEPADAGVIEIDGRECGIDSVGKAIRLGIAYCSEDRKKEGIVPLCTVKENTSLMVLKTLCSGIFIQRKKEEEFTYRKVEEFHIKTSSIEKKIYQLSGGNQQKVLLARGLAMHPRILILDEPTKGIDVGAKSEIYKMIYEIAEQGVSVILVSSELPEVIGLSDRLIVMRNKRIAGELNSCDATEEKALTYAMLEETGKWN